MADRQRLVRIVTLIGALFWVVSGAWALIAPHSFYDNLATFPPYNRHLFHDIGAFSVGLGACLLFALVWSSALRAVLAGAAVASVLHLLSHVVDRHLGGHTTTDLLGLGALAAITVVAAAVAGEGTRDQVARRR